MFLFGIEADGLTLAGLVGLGSLDQSGADHPNQTGNNGDATGDRTQTTAEAEAKTGAEGASNAVLVIVAMVMT